MATTNFDTFDAVGNREDLSDEIYDVSPTETPFMMAVGTSTATATLHEWQTDALAAASTSNAYVQGVDTDPSVPSATTRLTNRTQIMKKVFAISDTQEVVDKAGRESELDYQTVKKLKELKRDIEATITGNQAPVTGDSTTASKLRSLEAWWMTNTSRGSGGADPDNTTTLVATDATTGDLRAFTEDLLLDTHQEVFDSGGDPTMLMVGPANKRVVSGFAGGASRTVDAEGRRLIQAVDIYEGDFGTLEVKANRFSRSRTAHLIDPEYWSVAYLRPVFSEPLAKTGDAHKKHVVTELTLEAKNEASGGVVADLT